MKDKIKKPKDIDDYSNIIPPKENTLYQCPFCLSLADKTVKHECNEPYGFCSICGLTLKKKSKEVMLPNGRRYITMPSKKYFRIIKSLICWECAFKIVKVFKNET